jgi:hypothetical protein
MGSMQGIVIHVKENQAIIVVLLGKALRILKVCIAS